LNGRTYHYATIRLDGTDTGLFYANPGSPWELRRKRTSWLDWTVDSVAEMSTGLFLLLLGHSLRRVNYFVQPFACRPDLPRDRRLSHQPRAGSRAPSRAGARFAGCCTFFLTEDRLVCR
jgi:hypothetical protein